MAAAGPRPAGINEKGDIAADGELDGTTVALLLTPTAVPEGSPFALALLGLPLLGVPHLRRKFKRR